jgi:phosphoglucomutase
MTNEYFQDFEKMKKRTHDHIFNQIKHDYDDCFDIVDESYLSEVEQLTQNVLSNLQNWLNYDIPEKYKKIVFLNIENKKWVDIIEAFKQELVFGTSGIRGKLMISMDENDSEKDLLSLEEHGFDSDILRGSKSINEITITKNIYGLIHYMKKNNMLKVVIGFDSRTLSKSFSRLVTNIFLKNNFNVILFDMPNTLPELSFAVTNFNADMGIEITASHNDKRYNGYKLITNSGAPPSVNLRDELIRNVRDSENDVVYSLHETLQTNTLKNSYEKLMMIKKSNFSNNLIYSVDKLHEKYLDQLINLLSNKEMIQKYSSDIQIGYSALHGTGYDLSSGLFKKLNIKNIKNISSMILPDNLFSLFPVKQILDPSDRNTGKIVIDSFIKEFGSQVFEKLDFLCYTDPDADRLGIIVPTLDSEKSIYGMWKLLKPNDVWTLFSWYMLEILLPKKNNLFSKNEKLFIVKNFVTSDSIAFLSKKFGVECFDGKVGFSDLTSIVMKEWKNNKTNIGMFEESCGFGIAGNVTHPLHILEKDGMLSLAFLIEIVAFAKSQNTSIQNILNDIYQDPEIGFFVTHRKELPENDVFDGIKGQLFLQKILKNVEYFAKKCNKQIDLKKPLLICNLPITKVTKFSTGRFDEYFWKNFPDEGIRFTLDSETNHITIRSSGTELKIRIFVQYRITGLNKNNLLEQKLFGENLAKKLVDGMENLINSSLSN